VKDGQITAYSAQSRSQVRHSLNHEVCALHTRLHGAVLALCEVAGVEAVDRNKLQLPACPNENMKVKEKNSAEML
jgi:hypothetical protein